MYEKTVNFGFVRSTEIDPNSVSSTKELRFSKNENMKSACWETVKTGGNRKNHTFLIDFDQNLIKSLNVLKRSKIGGGRLPFATVVL